MLGIFGFCVCVLCGVQTETSSICAYVCGSRRDDANNYEEKQTKVTKNKTHISHRERCLPYSGISFEHDQHTHSDIFATAAFALSYLLGSVDFCFGLLWIICNETNKHKYHNQYTVPKIQVTEQ